ncbi:hypothetical protein Emtol_2721 [Emticicia oligotrophica DSM 17448]|uniref:DoxX family protein n=1 Tax=Emticicia oligotrophica (strain DSM 17448 / CIP 109782 / MTCC 6937 / GPTSA100-15) TaxID=929562 RepID=A0ABM5N346_EMTOG|nr:hypothetical protein [Emticicia oligotrophica]AFK03857.1 hypothetical protein Emtol_2721 [Emticicia oligotrophica DSM 17448]
MSDLSKWSISHKIAFYFSFLFLGLNFFPFPLEFLGGLMTMLWSFVVDFFGKIVFGIPEVTVRPNGSGDTTWNWLQQLAIVSFSTIGSIVWYVLARNRPNHEKLAFWFKIWLRYFLAATMFSYGLVKIFPLQFGNITTYRLFERLGEMSPMGLLWTFMAYSKGYQFFGGLMEVIGGGLLIFRRTTTLGAVMSASIMLNVFMMNVFYDVPVKIFSFTLLLMCVYLLAADAKRLWLFFVANKPTQSAEEIKVFEGRKWYKYGRIVLKTIFLGIVGVMGFYENFTTAKDIDAPKSLIYGPYKVERFERNNTVSETDTLRLQEVFIDRRGAYDMLYVTNDDGLRKRANFTLDSVKHILRMTDYAAPITDTTQYTFTYSQPDAETLMLQGKIKSDSIRVAMKKMKHRNFILTSRGFHWINEVPYNK